MYNLGQIRTGIWIGIKMESRIRIRMDGHQINPPHRYYKSQTNSDLAAKLSDKQQSTRHIGVDFLYGYITYMYLQYGCSAWRGWPCCACPRWWADRHVPQTAGCSTLRDVVPAHTPRPETDIQHLKSCYSVGVLWIQNNFFEIWIRLFRWFSDTWICSNIFNTNLPLYTRPVIVLVAYYDEIWALKGFFLKELISCKLSILLRNCQILSAFQISFMSNSFRIRSCLNLELPGSGAARIRILLKVSDVTKIRIQIHNADLSVVKSKKKNRSYRKFLIILCLG